MQNNKVKKYLIKMFLIFILIFIGLIIIMKPTKKNVNTIGYENIDFTDNKYGLYLSSCHAEIDNDYFKLNNFYDEAIKQTGSDFLGKSFILKVASNDEENAIKEAKKEIEKNPHNIIPVIYLSFIEFKNGNYQQSYDLLNNIKNKKDTFIIKLLKGWNLIALNENDKAMDLLETEINNPAFDNIILMNLGAMAELSNQDSYADELYQEALTTKLNLYDIEVIANYYLKKNQKQKAIDILNEYYTKTQDSISTYALLESIKSNKYKVQNFTLNDYMAKALFDLSNIMLILFPKNFDIYLMYLNMVLDLNPNLYMAQLMKAEVYKNNNKFDYYKDMINLIPDTSYINLINKINYAQYLLKRDIHTNEAIDILKNLIKEYPDVLQLYQVLGNYYKKQDDYDKALFYYTEGIKREVNNPTLKAELYYLRSIIYDNLNKKDKTQEDLKESLKLNTKNHIVLNYYAYFLLRNDIDIKEGFSFAERAMTYEPLNPYYLDTYGYAYYKQEKYDDAIKMFEYAKSIKPKNAVIINHLGDAYWKVGRKEEAKYEWKKAISYLTNEKEDEGLNETILQNKIHFGLN